MYVRYVGRNSNADANNAIGRAGMNHDTDFLRDSYVVISLSSITALL